MHRWILLLATLPLTGCLREVPAGHVGVSTKWGATVPGVMEPGTHLVNPLVTRVWPIDTRVQALQVQTTAASKDLQIVQLTVILNYRVSGEHADQIFEELGDLPAAQRNIILPTLQEGIKVATAQYNAEELVTQRSGLKQEMSRFLAETLEPLNIQLVQLGITEFAFSDAFSDAVVQRQVSAQAARKAEVDLGRIATEAQQAEAAAKGRAAARIIEAQAESEAQRILSESVNSEVIQLRMLERWDGKLPQVSSQASPTFSLNPAQ